MYIAIKSEIDSRPLLYQVIKSLWNYGSVIVISSNKQLRRLIDDETSQGFRNITVIVDEDGATDDIYNQYGIAAGDYDFVILDNMGVVYYDVCLVALGSKHSEEFDNDVKYMLEWDTDAKLWLVQFGRSQVKRSTTGASRAAQQRNKIDASNYDPAQKFHDKVKDNKEKQDRKRIVTVPYPTLDQIEKFEGGHVMFEVDQSLVKTLYDIFKGSVCVAENQFRKEVRKKDESSGNIRRRNTIGKE